MGIQGNKATTHEHDFLSLYTVAAAAKGPALQLHDAKPPPPSQGLFLRTHDFLQPLETPAPAPPSGGERQIQVEHALPGGIDTFSISHVPVALPAAAAAVVKAEQPLVLWGQPTAAQPVVARELTVRMDGKGGSCSGSGTDQRPNTPRSKHSATEQRRRSKINDRFQILRELLPHTDQKRDKATFLLEVIEYIRFLQEKVQKYEASFPEWNQENAKILPWSNIYFRSFWKNSQGKGQIPGDDLPDPLQFIRNGSSSGFNFTGKPDENHAVVTSAAASGAQDQVETDHIASVSYRSTETPTDITNNVTSQAQAQWASPSGVDDCAVNSEMLNSEQLAIDEGTISLSSQYSQQFVFKNITPLALFCNPCQKSILMNLLLCLLLFTYNRILGTLTHALESSGVDLSQASLSVQINLGKRAVKRPGTDGSSCSKELIDPASNKEMGHQLTMLGGSTEDLPHTTKRHKPGNS
ncbi:hypothetical protein ABZP36_035668 [Zizania latifolia]